jgi:hypothetical protein
LNRRFYEFLSGGLGLFEFGFELVAEVHELGRLWRELCVFAWSNAQFDDIKYFRKSISIGLDIFNAATWCSSRKSSVASSVVGIPNDPIRIYRRLPFLGKCRRMMRILGGQ